MKSVVGRSSLVVGKTRNRIKPTLKVREFIVILTSVIPTGVRPSALGWSNGVEEPAFSSPLQTARVAGERITLVAVLGALLLWMACAAGAQKVSDSQSDAQKQLSNITNSLANSSITSIDILHMPDRMETRASVNPENLERWFDSRITINKVREWAGRDELLGAMKSTRVAPNTRMPDLRSAIIFNGSDGQRVGVLYFGRYFGRYLGQFGGAEGAIGNIPVSFKGSLSTWLKNTIPSSLQ